jgi:MOSC domain-containing protein YiiM
MSAGIDMEMLRDGDIVVSGDTVTIKMPAPKVLRVERSGRVVWHNREVFSGFSEDPGLLDKIQNEGQARIVKTVLEQGELMRKARINAEDNLRNLILQLGYKNVVFTYDEKTTPTAPVTARPG